MPLTYISDAELVERLGTMAAGGGIPWRLQCGLAAEGVVDRYTRQPPMGALAFNTTSAGVVRTFDDQVSTHNYIPIDDAVTITAVVRDGITIASTDWRAWPLNPGAGPYTRLYLSRNAQGNVGASPFYNMPTPQGLGTISVTGTWGFCAVANLPPAVKEAVLRLAVLYVRSNNISINDMMQALTNPLNSEWNFVKGLLEPYRCWGKSALV